jgi:hypothetical protein
MSVIEGQADLLYAVDRSLSGAKQAMARSTRNGVDDPARTPAELKGPIQVLRLDEVSWHGGFDV